MTRPLLLDLFCGAGGASVGYHRAGFDVVGVDIVAQPRYPFRFIQGDALKPPVNLDNFDVIHASPPCQAYTQAQRLHGREHPDLVADVREMLDARRYVIENVPGSPLENWVQVCGISLGLRVKRHRWFETSDPVMGLACGWHGTYLTVFGHAAEWHDVRIPGRWPGTTKQAKAAMGIDWMSRDELSEAVPPAYTEFIGTQLIEYLERAA